MTIETQLPINGIGPRWRPKHAVPRRCARSRPGRWARVVRQAEDRTAAWLAAHSVAALRISLGLVFLGFGALKFVPGASPAEPLVMRTVEALSLGLISGTPAVVGAAVVETLIGLTLLAGIWMRAAVMVLTGSMVGIMSPVVLFFGDLFPGFVPTLEGQYVLKDIVLVAATAVVAARTLGARQVVTHSAQSPK